VFRGKTMNRDHTLEVAMHAYWASGVDGVSVNEICKLAKVSKSSAYREFGSEDGLMRAALNAYEAQALRPLLGDARRSHRIRDARSVR
jgi:AcrR family transcriptional regulator